jgi:hypothetical protein
MGLFRSARPKLIYAESARCPCGAGLAYRQGDDAWDCSAILTETAVAKGEPGSVQHTARLPFVFHEIRSENQPGAGTTRPEGEPRPEVPRQRYATREELASLIAPWLEGIDERFPDGYENLDVARIVVDALGEMGAPVDALVTIADRDKEKPA